jgi:hypothetical protein
LNNHRIVVSLQRVAAGLFGAGILFLAGAIVWPASSDALVTASKIAVVAFALPAMLAYLLSFWLGRGNDR